MYGERGEHDLRVHVLASRSSDRSLLRGTEPELIQAWRVRQAQGRSSR